MKALIHTISTWDDKFAVVGVRLAHDYFESRLLVTKDEARKYRVGDTIDIAISLREGAA